MKIQTVSEEKIINPLYSCIPQVQPTLNQTYLGKKNSRISKKQNLNFLYTSSYLHRIYTVLGIINLFPRQLSGKESACQARGPGLIPGSGRFRGKGHGNPLQYSCLENSMDRRGWQATVHRVTKSQTNPNPKRLWVLVSHNSLHQTMINYNL